MQRMVLNKGLLTELARCKRSFVMSLYHHNLNNETLAEKGTFDVNNEDVYNIRRSLLYDMTDMRREIDVAGGEVRSVVCRTEEIWDKVRETRSIINDGGPVFIVDGALEGDDFIVPVSILFVREDGKWEVYHMSTKSQSVASRKDRRETLIGDMEDAAPLMYVLSQAYADKVVKFGIIGADKSYLVPYPDPETGEIQVDADDAMMFVDLTDVLLMPDPPKLAKSIAKDIMGNIAGFAPREADYFYDTEMVEEEFAPRLAPCISAAQARSVIWDFCDNVLGWGPDWGNEFKEAFIDAIVEQFRIDYAADLSDYLGVENPKDKIEEIEYQIAMDPFWIPDVPEMDSRCKNPYPCPFLTYCKVRKDPNHVSFFLPYHDAKKLADNGYPTMEDAVELSYMYPTMTDIPRNDGRSGLFELSEGALREIRSYENGAM